MKIGELFSGLFGSEPKPDIQSTLPVVYTTKMIPEHRDCLHVRLAEPGETPNRVVRPEEVISLCEEVDGGLVVIRLDDAQGTSMVFTDLTAEELRREGHLAEVRCLDDRCVSGESE